MLSSMLLRRSSLPALVLTASLLLPFGVSANQIASDTFGPGDSYDTTFRYSGGQGFRFLATESGPLYAITVALGRDSESVTGASFTLSVDAGGFPGAGLETLTTANTTPVLPAPGAVVTLPSISSPMLHAGQFYWLFFSDTGPPGSVWFFNDQGFVGLRTTGVDATLPAFRVEVVPEPGTGLLVLAGTLVFGARRRSPPSLGS